MSNEIDSEIKDIIPFANKLAKEFATKSGMLFALDDFKAAAYLGLCIAHKKYDPAKAKLITYAFYVIKDQLKKTFKQLNNRKKVKTFSDKDVAYIENYEQFDFINSNYFSNTERKILELLRDGNTYVEAANILKIENINKYKKSIRYKLHEYIL